MREEIRAQIEEIRRRTSAGDARFHFDPMRTHRDPTTYDDVRDWLLWRAADPSSETLNLARSTLRVVVQAIDPDADGANPAIVAAAADSIAALARFVHGAEREYGVMVACAPRWDELLRGCLSACMAEAAGAMVESLQEGHTSRDIIIGVVAEARSRLRGLDACRRHIEDLLQGEAALNVILTSLSRETFDVERTIASLRSAMEEVEDGSMRSILDRLAEKLESKH